MSMMVTEISYLPGSKLRLKIVPCMVCHEEHDLIVTEAGYENWADGTQSIEEAFPELSPAERELLLSGIDGKCFPKGEEDEPNRDSGALEAHSQDEEGPGGYSWFQACFPSREDL